MVGTQSFGRFEDLLVADTEHLEFVHDHGLGDVLVRIDEGNVG